MTILIIIILTWLTCLSIILYKVINSMEIRKIKLKPSILTKREKASIININDEDISREDIIKQNEKLGKETKFEDLY